VLRLQVIPPVEGPRPAYRYVDSIHAALINALTTAGLVPNDLIGEGARPWTFAAEGWARRGGGKLLRALTLATPDPEFAACLRHVRPEAIRITSANGDRLDLAGGTITEELDPVAPQQGVMYLRPLSPFVVGRPRMMRSAGRWIEAIEQADLSAAFSAGLSRRIGREVVLSARVDRLASAGQPARAVPVRTRSARNRDVFIPAFNVPITLEGSDEDLRAAWFSGLGEKCRYGFGCFGLPRSA
jgi:CRISPR-associated endoribonuclease Cas6